MNARDHMIHDFYRAVGKLRGDRSVLERLRRIGASRELQERVRHSIIIHKAEVAELWRQIREEPKR